MLMKEIMYRPKEPLLFPFFDFLLVTRRFSKLSRIGLLLKTFVKGFDCSRVCVPVSRDCLLGSELEFEAAAAAACNLKFLWQNLTISISLTWQFIQVFIHNNKLSITPSSNKKFFRKMKSIFFNKSWI